MKVRLKQVKALSLVAVMAASIAGTMMSSGAHAADLTQLLVRFDRMKISSGTTGTVCAKPTTVALENDVQVTFPTGYTLGIAGTFAVSTTNLNWPATAVGWLGINVASNVTGQTVTFPSGDLTVGTLYCFNWTSSSAVTVSSSASTSNGGSVTTRNNVPAAIDSSNYATASLTDDSIVVTATVPQTFSLSLSNTLDGLGTLSSASVTPSPAPRTATIGTNAKNGWYAWAKDSNVALSSAAAGYSVNATTPGINATLIAGTEGYNMGVTSSHALGTGAITVATPYIGGLLGKGSGLDTSLREIARSTGTASGDILTLTNNAAINATTPAATDYTDTITVVAAGLF